MSKKTGQDMKVGQSLIVHGGDGRMGQEILRLAQHDGWAEVISVDRAGFDDVDGIPADVVIDFSSPQGLLNSIVWCEENGVPLVSGTTGLTDEDFKSLERASQKIPVLWAANMSLGVHVLAKAVQALSHLKDWDFQIEEVHHRMKKDKPSGTALFLQEELQKAVGKRELPEPLSLRAGGIIGVHKIMAVSQEELLCFEHQALSRSVFARGALIAAQWLAKRKGKAQLYQLADVLES